MREILERKMCKIVCDSTYKFAAAQNVRDSTYNFLTTAVPPGHFMQINRLAGGWNAGAAAVAIRESARGHLQDRGHIHAYAQFKLMFYRLF